MPKHEIDLNGKTILITGSPGFIGANLVMRLFRTMTSGTVISLDDMSQFYDPKLKQWRLRQIEKTISPVCHIFVRGSISDKALLHDIFEKYKPDLIVNLAAQAGVRYSLENPDAFFESNIIGFYNVLEACRRYPVEHLIYASSSSVYGGNEKVPFSTEDSVDHPMSLYAATKKSDELLAHAYSKLYNIPCTGLRFFTVYGPGGRPDMFYYSATRDLIAGKKIKIFNYGNMKRDFTYIDDVVEGVVRAIQGAPERKTGKDGLPEAPYALYNIGRGKPENLMDFVKVLVEELMRTGLLSKGYNVEEHMEMLPMQPGDVPVTYADTIPLERDFGYKPLTDVRTGLRAFVEWYKEYL